jgi:hypothetical protein
MRGGDATIATIRKQEIPPRAFDVCFADRYSLAVLRSSEVLKLDEAGLAKLAEAFKVPIGDTTAFSLTWDGWDLVRTLSRRVTVRG